MVRVSSLTLAVFVASVGAKGQMTRDLDDAIRSGDLVKAVDLAAKLDDAVQRRYRETLTRDSRERAIDVLSWVPADTEAMMVMQEPVVIDAAESVVGLSGKPARFYAIERLMRANGGDIYKSLAGRTIRLTVATMGNIRSSVMSVPGTLPHGDAAWFFFLTEPVDPKVLGPPTDRIDDGRLMWRVEEPEPNPYGEPASSQKPDEGWLALAKPDVLVLASSRDLLAGLLQAVAAPAKTRALPDTLPEWKQVDMKVSVWGIRHYSAPAGRRDTSNPRLTDPDNGKGDATAVGATVRYDSEHGALEIYILSGAPKPPPIHHQPVKGQFSIDQPADGVWRLRSDTRDRGDWPFHFAAITLGFGT